TIILIGATTENPFFEVNKALVSRSRVFQLKALTKEDLTKAAKMALSDVERGYGHWKVEFEKGALEHLVDTANGDARSLLNALELAVETTPEKWNPDGRIPEPAYGSTIYISKETAEESIQKKVVLYDRDGDYHYDIISAFIKSLRGRDPDAAMYWLARMIRAGEDPHFIFRRMLISACEDTGLADPYALGVVTACADAFDRVGLPEGRYHLAHAALYLATAPKSNSSMAFFDALASVEKEDAEVPNHLRDSSRDAEGFGHGDGYLYPHAYRDHWVAQQYLPTELVGRVFYTPTTQGYEAKIRDEVLSRREMQISSILENIEPEKPETGASCGMHPLPHFASDFSNPIGEWWINKNFNQNNTVKSENLTFTPKDERKESALDKADKSWRSRLDSNRAEVLLSIRDAMTNLAQLARHTRSLVWNADDGLLLWDVSRKTPEGITCGICRSEKGREIMEQYGRTLDDLDRPLLTVRPQTSENYLSSENFKAILEDFSKKDIIFDRIFFRDPFTSQDSADVLAYALNDVINQEIHRFSQIPTDSDGLSSNAQNFHKDSLLPENFSVIISQRIPCHGQRISDLVRNQVLSGNTEGLPQKFEYILKKMELAENEFFGDKENPLFNWNADTITESFKKYGFNVKSASKIVTEKRRISEAEISKWFDSENSAYGTALSSAVGNEDLERIKNLLVTAAQKTLFNWNTEIGFLKIEREELKA
ncbi:MAG: recombinase RarA, partial [Treponema sp.]|nr:recombinase RarA [Treponema sp.]